MGIDNENLEMVELLLENKVDMLILAIILLCSRFLPLENCLSFYLNSLFPCTTNYFMIPTNYLMILIFVFTVFFWKLIFHGEVFIQLYNKIMICHI